MRIRGIFFIGGSVMLGHDYIQILKMFLLPVGSDTVAGGWNPIEMIGALSEATDADIADSLERARHADEFDVALVLHYIQQLRGAGMTNSEMVLHLSVTLQIGECMPGATQYDE